MKKKCMGLGFSLGIIALMAVITLVMISCDILFKKDDVVDNSKYYLDPPTGITATKLSDNTLHLTWNAVSGAEYYEIRVRTNLDSEDTRLYLGTTTNTRYEHYYYSWYLGYYARPSEVTFLYYYIKAHPSKAGYIASDWSDPVYVNAH